MSAGRRIVLMGVAGCGKTTVGRVLADRLGGAFLDTDDLHPPDNIAKMSQGRPLEDNDRWPWLDAVAQAMKLHRGPWPLVVACSALKEAYRQRLGRRGYDLVYLRGSCATVAARLHRRSGHFMPATLLKSQFESLEEPSNALIVEIVGSPAQLAAEIVVGLGLDRG